MGHRRGLFGGDSEAVSDATPLVGSSSPQIELDTGLQPSASQNNGPSINLEHLVGRFLLITVAFLYGTLNVVLRWVYSFPGPPSASALSATRGWLAALCFVPLLANHSPELKIRQDEDRFRTPVPTWKIGLELAIWNFGAQALLTLGLYSTESARASFLTQCSVVMTPLVSAAAGHVISRRVWLACAVALSGLTLLSNSAAGLGRGFSGGDLIVLAGALCWSLYIFRLSSVGDFYDEIELQGHKTFCLAFLYSFWFGIASWFSNSLLWPGYDNLVAWLLIFYSAAGPGTFADIIQQKGQAKVSASESNVILSMEPVFTAILGRFLLGEITTWQEKLGGGLILGAALLATT